MGPESQRPLSSYELFGRETMDMAELIKLIHKASWPSEVIISPPDFIALSSQVAMGGVRQAEDGTPYFYIAGTKVRVRAPRPDVLDLSEWAPPLVTIAKLV